MKIVKEDMNDADALKLFKWRSDLKFLPNNMRTFDKFRNVFRFLHECIGEDKELPHKQLNYRQGTLYIIDIFLWSLAQYGYTLQKSRVKGCNFANLEESMHNLDISRRNNTYDEVFLDIINYKTEKKLNSYRTGDNPKYLPDFIKDFHDQKNLFKFIHSTIKVEDDDKDHILKQISYVEAQIYTIDYFLFIMFKYGYSLQKSRAKVSFFDIDYQMKKWKEKNNDNFLNMLQGGI